MPGPCKVCIEKAEEIRDALWQIGISRATAPVDGVKSAVAEILKLRETAAPAQNIDDDYVAWMRFAHRTDNQQPYLQICDSDAEGAFKVYRHPLPGAAPAEKWEYRAAGKHDQSDPCEYRYAYEDARLYMKYDRVERRTKATATAPAGEWQSIPCGLKSADEENR
jgi:hypothetical protein